MRGLQSTHQALISGTELQGRNPVDRLLPVTNHCCRIPITEQAFDRDLRDVGLVSLLLGYLSVAGTMD